MSQDRFRSPGGPFYFGLRFFEGVFEIRNISLRSVLVNYIVLKRWVDQHTFEIKMAIIIIGDYCLTSKIERCCITGTSQKLRPWNPSWEEYSREYSREFQ